VGKRFDALAPSLPLHTPTLEKLRLAVAEDEAVLRYRPGEVHMKNNVVDRTVGAVIFEVDADEEAKLAAWRTQTIQKIYMTVWQRMPDDVLRQVVNLIDEQG
jgi:hypothetical protein